MTHTKPDIQWIDPSVIIVEHDKRHRLTTLSGVESIIASIEEVGGIKMPIQLRQKGRGDDKKLVLVDGMHRLEAAIELEMPLVPVIIWIDITDDHAEMIELDMNLAGASLSPLDEAVFLAGRKRLYEKIHPETKAGVAGALGKWDANANSAVASFVKATADATGYSVRKIETRVAAGLMLSKDEVAKLRQAPQTLKAGDVEALAKVKDYGVRSNVIDWLKNGHAKSVGDAVKAISPTPQKSPERKADADYRKFKSEWKRLPQSLRERFIEECQDELAALLAGLGGGADANG